MVLKKPSYPLIQPLLSYLDRFERISKVSVFYDDLLRFSGSINVYDKNDWPAIIAFLKSMITGLDEFWTSVKDFFEMEN